VRGLSGGLNLTSRIHVFDVFGTPYVGLFATCTDQFLIVPSITPEKDMRQLGQMLSVEPVRASVASTFLIGVMTAANSNGLLLPKTALDEEVESLKRSLKDRNVVVLESKLTALGNLILANDRGAVVSPDFTQRDIRSISDALSVEVVRGRSPE